MASVPEGRHEEVVRKASSGDPATQRFIRSIGDLLRLTRYFKVTRHGSSYDALFAKPNQTMANALLIDRELLILVADYEHVEPRTLGVAREIVEEHTSRLYPRLSIVVHADAEGDEKLIEWATQEGMDILPLYAGPLSQMSPHDLKVALGRAVYASDPFQVTGPVAEDDNFFGRKNAVLESLRSFRKGQIKSIFGLRKVGKTSVISRIAALARQDADLSVAVIDCSIGRFSEASTETALTFVEAVGCAALNTGYADMHSLPRGEEALRPAALLKDLGDSSAGLLIIFDEVDSISPFTGSNQWDVQFVPFWREVRSVVQEANRRGNRLSLLVSGVSSKPFRVESIRGDENPVLHFVPEEYLGPFPLGASESMVRELGKRCGLAFDRESCELISTTCGGFPFWVRMLGSFVHRCIELDVRPAELSIEEVAPLVDEFISGEGAEIALVALQNLNRIYPEVYAELVRCWETGSLSLREGGILLRYGLGVQVGLDVVVQSSLLDAGLQAMQAGPHPESDVEIAGSTEYLHLTESEWAEELAAISQRRNLLENRLREVIRVTLTVAFDFGWQKEVIAALPEHRRSQCSDLSATVLLQRLYWIELKGIISKHWPKFEKRFSDKRKMQQMMDIVNERPDAHAKDFDQAEIALMRTALDWLESCVSDI